MRKVSFLFALMIPFLFLSGCLSGGESQKLLDLALTVREEYLATTQFSARAELTADHGQRVYPFTLDVTVEGDDLTLTIVEPTILSGITAKSKGGELFLEYEDFCLETGSLTDDGLSPMTAIPAMLEQLRRGYLMTWGTDTDGSLRITLGAPDGTPDTGTVYDLWLDPESHALLRGEISNNGRRCIQCTFSSYTKE